MPTLRKLARPTIVTGTVLGVGLLWRFTGPSGNVLEYPRQIDAAIDAAIDSSIDAPPGDPATPWVRHTITQGSLSGSDGVNLKDANGDGLFDVVSPWEQSGKLTVSFHPGMATVGAAANWQTVELPCNVIGAEDAIFADVDADGAVDAIGAGEGKTITIAFAPTNPANLLTSNAWTCVTINAATNLQRWLQLAFADLDGDGVKDVIAGGGVYPASLGYFTSPTPRTASSWTYHQISQAGYVMSIVPLDVDADGDSDLVISDREPLRPPGLPIDISLRGSRWSENPGNAIDPWPNHTIKMGGGAMKFLHATLSPKRVIDGFDSTAADAVTSRSTTDWITWTPTTIPRPSNVGNYQGCITGDIDGDGDEDIVISYSRCEGDLSCVVWLSAPAWDRYEVSGSAGEKFDNALLYDVDGDGDLDIVTGEQGNQAGSSLPQDQLGVIWYENPGYD